MNSVRMVDSAQHYESDDEVVYMGQRKASTNGVVYPYGLHLVHNVGGDAKGLAQHTLDGEFQDANEILLYDSSDDYEVSSDEDNTLEFSVGSLEGLPKLSQQNLEEHDKAEGKVANHQISDDLLEFAIEHSRPSDSSYVKMERSTFNYVASANQMYTSPPSSSPDTPSPNASVRKFDFPESKDSREYYSQSEESEIEEIVDEHGRIRARKMASKRASEKKRAKQEGDTPNPAEAVASLILMFLVFRFSEYVTKLAFPGFTMANALPSTNVLPETINLSIFGKVSNSLFCVACERRSGQAGCNSCRH